MRIVVEISTATEILSDLVSFASWMVCLLSLRVPVAIPANARITSFLPYALIMPEIDLLITNGGYGTVNMAVSHGIPVISAGLTEDKEEVSAHVQWSGAGIDLRTNQATPEAIKQAVDEVFTQPGYRERALLLSLEFASHDVEVELLRLIEKSVPEAVGTWHHVTRNSSPYTSRPGGEAASLASNLEKGRHYVFELP